MSNGDECTSTGYSKDYMVLINNTLQKFLDVDINNYQIELEKSLEEIGSFFDFDRIYMYYFLEDPTFMKIECQWSKNGIGPKREIYHEEVAYELPWLIREIKKDEFVAINNVLDLPNEAIFEKAAFCKEGIKACLIVSQKSQNELIGFIGYESLSEPIVWDVDIIKVLKDISRVFSSARARITKVESYETTLNGQSILLNNSEAQLWALRNVTAYAAVNEAHARFFGKEKKELEYQDLYDIFPLDIANKLSENNWELFQKNEPSEKELEITDWKGEDRLLLIKSKPQKDNYGNIKYIVCTAEDITEQRMAQNELYKAKIAAEAANVMKSQFLANMSHEIRTPMNGILGFLDLLQRTNLSFEQKDYMNEAKTASEILLYLINDILDFSKIEAGKLSIEKTSFKVRTAVENAMSVLILKAAEKNIEFYTEIKSNVPEEVMGDPTRLRQILNNLISNAVKFTEKGEINVTVECAKEIDGKALLIFEVKDTGIGISEEDIKKLFMPFTQADASMTRKFGGTGLGLAISKELVSLMDGEISVESKVGKGSTFKFSVLIEISKKYKEDAAFTKLERVNVLVAYDNKNNGKIISGYLEDAGCKVFEAEGADKAITTILVNLNSKNKINLAIVDFQMLGMNGYELAATLKTIPFAKDVKLILLTSVAQNGDACAAKEHGFSGYISKPVRRDELLNCVSTVLALKKEMDEDIQIVTRYTVNELKENLQPTILLVEDNEMNRKIIITILKNKNMTCDIAVDGIEAIKAVAKKNYDIVFMDCQMPVMDGYESTAKIREMEGDEKHTIIIAMTANAMEGDRTKCIEAGMDDYISKPINFNTMFNMIEANIKYKQQSTEYSSFIDDNIDHFVESTGLRKDDAKELFVDYIKCFPDFVEGIKESIVNSDFEKLGKLAHQLKGSSGNLKINSIYELAIELENSALKGEVRKCESLLIEIQKLFY